MSENNKFDSSKLSTELLRSFRAQGLTYGEVGCVLSAAQLLLQRIGEMELYHLPIADGIEDCFNPDSVKLTATFANRSV